MAGKSQERGEEVARRARGRCVAEKSANGMYEWRLRASNGRIVGASPASFRTAAEAAQAYLALREESTEHLARIAHEKAGIGWVWSVPGPRGRPLAVSPRAYERHATCQNAFRKFVALLATTSPPEAGEADSGHPIPAVRRE